MLKRAILAALVSLALITASVAGGTLTLIGVGGGAVSGAAPTITFLQETHETALTNVASHTFASVNIGTAAANRSVIVTAGCGGAAARIITDISIGGTSATLSSASNSSAMMAAVGILNVAAGTTANIVVTFGSATNSACSIGTYAANGLASTTADAIDNSATSVATSLSAASVNNGVSVGVVAAASGSTGTFGGTLTNRYNNVIVAATSVAAGGSQLTTGAASTLTYNLAVANAAALATYH